MTTASISTETVRKPRLQGLALIAVITALMLTLLLKALDQTVVGTAMPRIIREERAANFDKVGLAALSSLYERGLHIRQRGSIKSS